MLLMQHRQKMLPLIGSQHKGLEHTMNSSELASLAAIACHAFEVASPVFEILSGLHGLWLMIDASAWLPTVPSLCDSFVQMAVCIRLYSVFSALLQLARIYFVDMCMVYLC